MTPTPPSPSSPAAPQGSTRSARVDSSLLWLFIYFLGGLLIVIGLRVFFNGLKDDIDQRNANEQARLFVGEEIIQSIRKIETDLYKMASTANPNGVRLIQRSVDAQLRKLGHDLLVLRDGGTVRREILLNIEGMDEMVWETPYRPDAQNQGYVMELIEIAPLLDQLDEKTDALTALLTRRWEAQEHNDPAGFFRNEQDISAFLKFLPPLFQRLDENANRLFYDSSQQLKALDAELALQKKRLALLEGSLIALVVILATLGSIIFMRRIHHANQAREQALADARQAQEQAEQASRAKSEFVSRMSHELRTPLNAILGFAQLLEEEPMQASQKHYVGLINSSGKHLMELINAVLDHAKIEAGSLTLEHIPFDFPATIESVVSIVADRATGKGLGFIADISPNLPRHIQGDPTRLRQILINLLINAVKFTEQGTVELRIGVDEGQLVFSIRDSGIGMDEATLGRLFQPFAQADESITRKYGGTGLGLLISRELVLAMGGHIEVDSAPGTGTCFWVRLPLELAPAPATPAPAAPAADQDPGATRLIQGRVLLVDDNRVNQQLGAAMLNRLSLPHDLADNGLTCLERMAGQDYALILMDMEMPEMDGVTCTREIRRREQERQDGRHIPIIAMTANALAEDRERCLAAGMDGYLSKPISLPALESEIRRVFSAIQPAAAAPASPPAASAPLYDRAAALEALGDEELLGELTALFAADAPNYLVELEQSLADEDWPALARIAHTLKGLFATFCAGGPEGQAKALEQAARGGGAALCRQLAPEVIRQTQALAALFKAH